jgi:phage protein D
MSTEEVAWGKLENQWVPSENMAVVTGRVEDDKQARELLTAAVANKEKVTSSFSVPGNPKLVAGVNVLITGFGAFSGKWHITSSTHKVSNEGGYITDITARKLD